MRGKVLGFDYDSGRGQISGEDGTRYSFAGADWQTGQRHPAAGDVVDFEPQQGSARAVYRVLGNSTEKNRIVAALLAFFLGGLGIHKFYLGKNGAGLTMLLCTFPGMILLFIPTIVVGIIAFVEFIIYLVIDDAEFNARYVDGDRSWF